MYETGHTQWCMAQARLHGERSVIEAKMYKSQKPRARNETRKKQQPSYTDMTICAIPG